MNIVILNIATFGLPYVSAVFGCGATIDRSPGQAPIFRCTVHDLHSQGKYMLTF